MLFLPGFCYSHWQIYSFTDIRTYFFMILAYTEDLLRHQPSGLNSYWLPGLLVGAAIVGLARAQPVSYSNEPHRDSFHQPCSREPAYRCHVVSTLLSQQILLKTIPWHVTQHWWLGHPGLSTSQSAVTSRPVVLLCWQRVLSDYPGVILASGKPTGTHFYNTLLTTDTKKAGAELSCLKLLILL